jgi:hypothetical protein
MHFFSSISVEILKWQYHQAILYKNHNTSFHHKPWIKKRCYFASCKTNIFIKKKSCCHDKHHFLIPYRGLDFSKPSFSVSNSWPWKVAV